MYTLLTLAEAAERLRAKPATLRDWRRRGYGPPCFKVGRRTVYRETDVERWLDEQSSRAQVAQ